MGARINTALAQWILSEVQTDEFFTNFDLANIDMKTISQEDLTHVEDVIQDFFMTHTKEELYEGALSRGINLGPVWNARDMLKSVQLNARDFWVDIDHPVLGRKLTYPGDFFKSSGISCRSNIRAPLIGEHNSEIFHEVLGISDSEVEKLRSENII